VTPVKLVDSAGQASGYSSRTTNVRESLSDFSRHWNRNTHKNTTCKEEEPFTKPSKTTPNRPRTDQQHHDPKTHESSNSPKENLLTVYFGTPNMFITLWFGFVYGTNPPLGTLIT
jgi:hypothetical protein